MGARGVFVVAGLAATAGAAYLALAPVSAEVSTSVFPDWVLDNVQFRLGSKVGVTVAPGSAYAEVTCGSPLSPYEIRVDDGNWLSGLLDHADRIEGRVSSACGDAIDGRGQRALLAALAAAVLFIMAIVSGGRSHVPESASSSGTSQLPPPGWYPDPSGSGAVTWWNGSTWTSASTAPGGQGQPEPASARDVSEPSADHDRRRERFQALAAGTAAVVVVVIVAMVVSRATSSDDDGSSAFVSVAQRGPTTIDVRLLREQQCMREAFTEIDRAFASAWSASEADREGSSLNLDGDSSWRDFGESLRGVDTVDCPAEFRSTMIEFSNAWTEYGEDWLGASKGLSFDGMSDEEAQRHIVRINQARALLEDIAVDHAVEIRRVSYSFG